ncbi:helix-turn-helix transcriptional regulator [Sphingobacterium sp. DN00404]|uniref:Helix-turn-helix transcriptional regulator n=1 Tax=Sphingobacterium micropteri TaxID=2763501 RepID=A0ABR7YV83_9SPHI|nr:AraC family transcriptional regulator [Sphingobacterium micropteri]MBD1435118.1 helix-turn-helix transcriptional regulator [Sphingobacterium micropteri]
MLVKAKLENHNEWLFLEEIPEKYVPNHRLSERQISIKNAPVDMKNYQLSTNGLFLLYSEMNFSERVRIETEVEGDAIASQFIFCKEKGNLTFSKSTRYARGRHNIRYIPASRESYEVKADQEYVYFLVVLSKDYYLHLVDTSSPLHEDFMREMEKGVTISFMDEDLYITPEMRKSIEGIRECKHDGGLKRMFTDARIMELIIYQLEQFSQFLQNENEILHGEDIEKLEVVRELLESNYVNPPTQKELARVATINESKLRTGFKKYYGTTIYDFITRLRMVEARRLIMEEKNNNMNEIAMLVGFKHQSNFTRAFKRYYGLSPTEVGV